jgi:hypothetical protein
MQIKENSNRFVLSSAVVPGIGYDIIRLDGRWRKRKNFHGVQELWRQLAHGYLANNWLSFAAAVANYNQQRNAIEKI